MSMYVDEKGYLHEVMHDSFGGDVDLLMISPDDPNLKTMLEEMEESDD